MRLFAQDGEPGAILLKEEAEIRKELNYD